MTTLKPVNVKTTKFTEINNHHELSRYIGKCIEKGSVADIFKNPHILTAFYDEGTIAKEALDAAITIYEDAPINSNLLIIEDKMALVVLWLMSYAAKVTVISNLDINRTTRDEAATNVTLSWLTPHKIGRTAKLKPDTPVLVSENVGTGKAMVKIINSNPFNPKSSFFIAVSKPQVTVPPTPDAEVSIVEGQFLIHANYPCQVFMITVDGKGRVANFKNLTPAGSYNGYCFSKNGNKLISYLSEPVLIKG